ncbi:YibE/F family protein [Antribacter gilvus]|uniref:YibE/F family protein n=1 Tax=Antribacter gilvus TaxID=2304675 RepID=UPI000F782C95|nr:YibE/F family protein [Antribacter gilvus]
MAAHAHSHGPVPASPPRTRAVLAATLVPALLATLIGLWALWPSADEVPDRVPVVAEGSKFVDVTIEGHADPETGSIPVRLPSGELSSMQSPGPTIPLEPGDRIVALSIEEIAQAVDPLVFMDFQREVPLGWLAVAYGLVVLLVARWRGLAAMVGLGVAFAVLLGFTMPALLAGQPAMAVALVTASLVMFATLYLAHGFSARTSAALLGTLLGLALTAVVGGWAAGAAQLTGATSESAQYLPSAAPGADLRGIALCGLVLAGMGVLNDVTITQASAVWELRAVAPGATRGELFARAMRIGRDHIASTVYTIAFAYVGAALPLIMMVWLIDQSPVSALSSGEIAEEVVRTLVGSIGLVLAIPITTAIAALAVPGPVAGAYAGEPGPGAGPAAGPESGAGPQAGPDTDRDDDLAWAAAR